MTEAPLRRAVLAAALAAAAVLGVGGLASAAEELVFEGESWSGPVVDGLLRGGESAVAPFQPRSFDVGEQTAREDLASGEADVAVTSVALSAAERSAASAKGREVAYVPYAAGAVAIVVALDVGPDGGAQANQRLQQLNLTVPLVAKLFTHNIVRWDDPEILAVNPDNQGLRHLRDPNVAYVARKDSSSSTATLIKLFLSDPEARTIWNDYATSSTVGAPPDTPLDKWPNDDHAAANVVTGGSKAAVDKILFIDPSTGQKVPGAASNFISYLATSWALDFNVPRVTLQTPDGATKVDPSPEAVAKAVAKATVDAQTNIADVPIGMSAGGEWPATMVSYLAVPTSGTTTAKAGALAAFTRFALGETGQKIVAEENYVPVTAAMRERGLGVAGRLEQAASSSSSSSTTSTTGANAISSTTPTIAPSNTSSTTSEATTAATVAAASLGPPSSDGSVTGASATPSATTAAPASTGAGPATPARSTGTLSTTDSDGGLAITGAAAGGLAVIAGTMALVGELLHRRTRRRRR